VNLVVCHGMFFSRMQSGVGRNVQLCCERYGRYMTDLLHLPPKQKLNIKIDKFVENRVGMIKELAMVRDGLMSVYGDRFTCADVWVLIDLIRVSIFILYFSLLFHFSIFFIFITIKQYKGNNHNVFLKYS